MRLLVWRTGLRAERGRRMVARSEKNDGGKKMVDLSTSFGGKPAQNYNDSVY